MRPAIPGPTDNSAFNLLRLHLAAPMSDRDCHSQDGTVAHGLDAPDGRAFPGTVGKGFQADEAMPRDPVHDLGLIRRSIDEAWQDLQDWAKTARGLRERSRNPKGPDFDNVPHTRGIAATEAVLDRMAAAFRALDRLEGKDRRAMSESLGEQRDREAHERLSAARQERRQQDRRAEGDRRQQDRRAPAPGAVVRADPVGRAIEAMRCAERSLEADHTEAAVDYVRQALLALGSTW